MQGRDAPLEKKFNVVPVVCQFNQDLMMIKHELRLNPFLLS